MKCTKKLLGDVVARTTTYAGVLRILGIAQSGGAHAHIRRRIEHFGLDTSHFTGRGNPPGTPSPRRVTPKQVLVVRSPDRRKAHGSALTRALLAIGVPLECTSCGTGPQWNGAPLVLHVDHINGDPYDCRAENLRFLCPNCHSQTSTYAGRGRRSADQRGHASERPAVPAQRTTPTVERAAALLGCSPSHFYRLRSSFAEQGRASPTRTERAQTRERGNAAIIALALANPEAGPQKIANRLREPEHGAIVVSHGTVTNVLRAAGLARRDLRLGATRPGPRIERSAP